MHSSVRKASPCRWSSAVALRGPDQRVAAAGDERGAPLPVGRLRGDRVELGVVVDLVLHAGAGHGRTLGVDHADGRRGRRRVVVGDVDLGEELRAAHHLLGSLVAAEDVGVKQHGAAGRGVEPPQVEHRLGLARPEEVPLPVGPRLDPGVVVVGVGPARGVDLAGGDAHRAQRRDQQRRLLAAAARGGPDHGQRGARARVGRRVDGLLVAPVVHLQDGVGHREAAHAVAQLVVEDEARAVEVLVVDAHGQHEVAVDHRGNPLAPGHLGPHALALAHVVAEIVAREVHGVAQRHVGVQEAERLAFARRERWVVERLEGAAAREQVTARREVLLHALPVGGVGEDARLPVAGRQQNGCGQQRRKSEEFHR